MERLVTLLTIFLTGYNKNPGPKPNGPRTFNANSVSSTFEKGASLSFTNEQMMKLMNLINEAHSGIVQANMTGMGSFFNNNVFFNLNFKIFYNSNFVMCKVTLGWIIDSRANQHMTISTLNMFGIIDRDLNFTKDSHVSPCDICHKAKQTREPFPSSDHLTIDIGCLLIPNDDGRVYDTPHNDGNVHPCSSSEDDFSTSMGETSSSEGNVHINSDSPTQCNLPENISQGQPDLRRSTRVPKMPAKFNDSYVNSSKKYGLDKYVTYTNLNTSNYCFSTNLNKSSEPTSYFETIKNPNWIEEMNNKIEALNINNTWTVCDLPMEEWLWCMLNVVICNGWNLFQLDINNAFLYGGLSEDVYMTLPPGFDNDKSKVCKLNKSLHGLEQAPRQWNAKLTQALTEHRFVQSKFDYSLFTKNSDNVFIILLVYVDDIVVTGNNLNEIEKFKQFLMSKFQIKGLGKLKYFLGIKILDNKDSICLNQRKYYLELLHEFGLLAAKHVDTPLPENVTLNHIESDDDHLLVKVLNYQRLVGKLIYLSNTRPGIAYVVHCLSQYMHSPLNSYLDAALRVLRYLKGSSGSSIQINKIDNLKLGAYADSDRAMCPATRKSISGYCVFVGDSLITWISKKWSTLSRSSAEAEYRSMASATCEVIWLSILLGDIGVKNLLPVVMYCDNSFALQIAVNPVFHEKSKHFEIDVHLGLKLPSVDSCCLYKLEGQLVFRIIISLSL
nr:ribonuclease H-like domain-containing protein [Tanacetum cinerariifolium]